MGWVGYLIDNIHDATAHVVTPINTEELWSTSTYFCILPFTCFKASALSWTFLSQLLDEHTIIAGAYLQICHI